MGCVVIGLWDDVGSVDRSCADILAPLVLGGILRGSCACNVATGFTELDCRGVSWSLVGDCVVHEPVARPRG